MPRYAGITEAEAARLLAPGTAPARRGVHRAHARAAAGRTRGWTTAESSFTGENEWNRQKPTPEQIEQAVKVVAAMRAEIGKAVVGQAEVVDQVLAALLAGGHVLVEGVPGLGKTLLVRALAQDLRRQLSRASSSRPT